MAMIPVRDINLKNAEFISILDEYKDIIMRRDKPNDDPLIHKVCQLNNKNFKAEDWVSDEYMNSIISLGTGHDGFPKVLKGYSGLKYVDQAKHVNETVKEATATLNTKLNQFLSSQRNALNACYPPGGFISWHNNANAAGYNIIITYSETGDGWFDYWDLDRKERVRIQDKPGWQAKMTYFGSYHDPDKLCYHAAYTDCYRITCAFVFAEADNFWKEVIEDLETEY